MLSLSVKQKLTRHLVNIPGWHTNRKIVVFESDDWGSIRMPSQEVYQKLLNKGIRVDNLSYNRYDSLASEEDLSRLFEVLLSVRDKNGNPAIFTANTIVANPDFDKIRESNFGEYYYEPFTETLKRYPQHSQSFFLWQKGIRAGVFKPQFHGREHLNVNRWMRALQQNTGNVRVAFDYQMYDLSESFELSENSFMEALNFENESEFQFQKESIEEGLKLFEHIFGYHSETFIAPCYIWSSKLNGFLKKQGINALQGGWYQFEPQSGKDHKFRKLFHYTGQLNNSGQYYLNRNVHFEPSENPEFDWINDALKRIETIFRWGKPAIISTHRLNYIGFIDPANREQNLPKLKHFLDKMITQWPDVEFMSSDQLLTLINGNT